MRRTQRIEEGLVGCNDPITIYVSREVDVFLNFVQLASVYGGDGIFLRFENTLAERTLQLFKRKRCRQRSDLFEHRLTELVGYPHLYTLHIRRFSNGNIGCDISRTP